MAKITTTLYGSLAFLPFIAEIPIVETLAWLSDSMESFDGSEQNIQLRNKPRQSFQYSIPIKLNTNPEAFNTAWGAIRNKWAIPQWTDLQIVGNITAGASLVVCNTADYDLRDSSLAMLLDGCGNYQILEITTAAAGQINISGTTNAFRGAMLIPVRVGYATGAIQRPFSGFAGTLNLNFDVDDLKEVTPTAPDQYLGEDIYYKASLLDSGKRDAAITKREDIIDYDLGLVGRRSPWLRPKFGSNYRSLTMTPAERTEFRNFLHRRQGKSRYFWLPTFDNNLRIKNTGTVTSTLVVWADSYIDYANNRTHVAIEAGGVWYPRVISAPTPTDATTIQLTLSSALNVPASSITRVSYLGLNRLDTDTVDFNYNSPVSVESTVRLLELQP